jgi:hypothetical protein
MSPVRVLTVPLKDTDGMQLLGEQTVAACDSRGEGCALDSSACHSWQEHQPGLD